MTHFRKSFGRISCQPNKQSHAGKNKAQKSRAQELPIATCTAIGPAHLSAPNLSNIIGYAAMERFPTFSGDHGALTNRHRRPGRGACPSPAVPKQPTGPAKSWLIKKVIGILHQIKGRRKKQKGGKSSVFALSSSFFPFETS